MSPSLLIAVLLVLSAFGFLLGRRRSVATAEGRTASLHSVPGYHGSFVALWCGVPALILILLWVAFEPALIRTLTVAGMDVESITEWARVALPAEEAATAIAAVEAEGPGGLTSSERELMLIQIVNMASGSGGFVDAAAAAALEPAAERMRSLGELSRGVMVVAALLLAIAGGLLARRRISRNFRARNAVERMISVFLIACSVIAILTTIGIVLSLLFESLRFFAQVSPIDFLTGLNWSPQTALRADQAGSSGAFGAVPLFTGTILISAIAMLVAVPIGLMSAIYLSDYASKPARAIIKPVLEILAGIPTVVYGFFAILTVAPFLRDLGDAVGLPVASNSALAAGVVMGIMIVPFVSSLSDDVINAVPQSLRDGSAGLGATKSETMRQVVLPAALPGIVGAVLLAVSRAIGETMIVVMAAGLAANLTANPFQAVTTVTVQIATLLVGDQEFDSAKTLSVFALGLVLFTVTLALNVVALRVVQKYREKYD